MTGADIVDAVVSEGGFDTSASGVARTVVTGWCKARYDDLVIRARWRMAIVALGPTVAAEPDYALPDTTVEAESLRVDSSRPWARVGLTDVWSLETGDTILAALTPGVFGPYFDDAGASFVRLYPTPESAGLAIDALCAVAPVTFADSASFTPIVPIDFHRDLVRGATADGKRLVFGQQAEADADDAWWETRVEALRRRKLSRVGQGPQQLVVTRRPR